MYMGPLKAARKCPGETGNRAPVSNLHPSPNTGFKTSDRESPSVEHLQKGRSLVPQPEEFFVSNCEVETRLKGDTRDLSPCPLSCCSVKGQKLR